MNWLKQTPDKPLFPDLLWSRPENRRHAGKLLVVGGNAYGFKAPVAAYSASLKAGAGTIRVILPGALKKTIGTSLTEAEFASSTPSGSFAKSALDVLLENAQWADGALLAGDFGRNSETSVLLSSFLEKYNGQVTFAQDGVDYFLSANSFLLKRRGTVSVIKMDKLQKLGRNNKPEVPIRHAMNLSELVQLLSDWRANIITLHANNFIVAADGKVSTTPVKEESNWQVELAAYASVWWLQQSDKIFEALTSAVYDYAK